MIDIELVFKNSFKKFQSLVGYCKTFKKLTWVLKHLFPKNPSGKCNF